MPLNAIECPYCHLRLGRHDCVEDDTQGPSRGDGTLCAKCRNLSVFDTNNVGRLYLRKPTIEESNELESKPEMKAARKALSQHPQDPDALIAEARRLVDNE